MKVGEKKKKKKYIFFFFFASQLSFWGPGFLWIRPVCVFICHMCHMGPSCVCSFAICVCVYLPLWVRPICVLICHMCHRGPVPFVCPSRVFLPKGSGGEWLALTPGGNSGARRPPQGGAGPPPCPKGGVVPYVSYVVVPLGVRGGHPQGAWLVCPVHVSVPP